MKYFLDTEFIEDGKTIDLISIGIVSEDNRELYLISSEYDYYKASDWVKENVIQPMHEAAKLQLMDEHLSIETFHKTIGLSKQAIKDAIKIFVKPKLYGMPEFWAYFADYDWVVFCQIFGTMMDLPDKFPMFCLDLKQEMYLNKIEKLAAPKGIHNALVDAKWNKEMYEFIQNVREKQSRLLPKRHK